jgi:hypothetical protein
MLSFRLLDGLAVIPPERLHALWYNPIDARNYEVLGLG